ncbi:MAG: aminotransferase class III-fold pyridoxal phosphate-dependent enzyme, partial [Gammaproteobacteria bacterium]|nr:aminotransferase class III-fold pyridoxal phosphate-dependent enzyme [Gammaproteobacteria bacterium]
EQGRKILDLVNNVAHVGHAHPRVVAAIAQQEAQLNTNTRYLHDGLVTYAERLTALLPDELDTCFLVCTGSEANELALRLARAYTGSSDVVVVDGAYHGHSSALIDLSPYKFNGAGGAGRAPHVQVAAMPDAYNGVYADDPASSDKYGQSVGDAFARVARQGRKAAAFFCESALGCGGQIILPPGYLQRAYHHARSAGAVCVADEVQVGFGRLGGELWAFEAQGVVPDILTLGKPIGNGYPLAAVVTRRDIAEAFANGMEYFNTFGGNPVACAAGHAVLDVLLDEALPARAGQLGARWLEALRELEKKNEIVGDVRGQGLFIGIELVKDRQSREANPKAARAVLDALRQKDIQISIDGPRYNVLKIKPPMVIEEQDMERVSVALGEAIDNLARK